MEFLFLKEQSLELFLFISEFSRGFFMRNPFFSQGELHQFVVQEKRAIEELLVLLLEDRLGSEEDLLQQGDVIVAEFLR